MTLAEFGTVFGYEGVFDKFFTDNALDKQVDMSGRRWALFPGVGERCRRGSWTSFRPRDGCGTCSLPRARRCRH